MIFANGDDLAVSFKEEFGYVETPGYKSYLAGLIQSAEAGLQQAVWSEVVVFERLVKLLILARAGAA